jgi:glutamyl-tRNA synthetase
MIRVRFAPSPTGYLHIGGARTALFNWLYARRHGGVFVLRIEDTDVERSSEEMVEGILDGMRWLGLDWDEGPKVGGTFEPYFQSARLDRYRAMAAALVASGHAYYCYCAPETLREKREAAEQAGGAWKYDRTCAALTAAEHAERAREGRPRAVRIHVPEGPIEFTDQVHGPIVVDGANVEDFVILRSDGHPTYHLSVVSDDVEMMITHVVRGDDHISNTPKQILLYRAIGAEVPAFAHVPLILGPDKKRLSKRHGATSVMEYAKRGYLPEAMVNFLALLGWSPGVGDREIFSQSELAEVFDLGGISGGNAVFNPEKLDWYNQQYLARLAPDELAVRLRPWFESAGFWAPEFLGTRHAWFFAILELLCPRVKRLDEFVDAGRFFFVEPQPYDEAAAAKHLRVEGMAAHLVALADAFGDLGSFDVSSSEAALRGVAEARGIKAATLIHAVRVALTGRSASPGLFEVAALLGRERVDRRLRSAADSLSS